MPEGVHHEQEFEPAYFPRVFADALVDPIGDEEARDDYATLRFSMPEDATLTDRLRNVSFFNYFVLNPHNNGQPVEYILQVEEQLEQGAITVHGREAHAQLTAMASYFAELSSPKSEHFADRALYTDKYLVPSRLRRLLGDLATGSEA